MKKQLMQQKYPNSFPQVGLSSPLRPVRRSIPRLTKSGLIFAEYQTQLPDKKPLQAKLHWLYLQNTPDEPGELQAKLPIIGLLGG
jgi:hypothetical protein